MSQPNHPQRPQSADRRSFAGDRSHHDGHTPALRPVPAIRREKLMIERIGLGGLLALWSPAVVVAFVVPYLCGLAVFKSHAVGAVAATLCGGLVAARAVFWIKNSLAQWRKRRGL